jgi:hypothetical protein
MEDIALCCAQILKVTARKKKLATLRKTPVSKKSSMVETKYIP